MFSKKIVRNILLIVVVISFFIVFFIISKHVLDSIKNGYNYGKNFFAMDTIVSAKSENDITNDIEEIFSEYQNIINRNDNESEISKLNSDGSIIASDILQSIVSDTLELNKKHGNSVDITIGRLTDIWNVTDESPKVPYDNDINNALKTVGTDNITLNGNEIILKNNTSLDFGAVGKGAVLDSCLEYLKENQCGKTYVSTGSSVLFYGDDSFDVSITNPEGGILASVKTEPCFLSTSGGYERYFEIDNKRYCHIIDTRTGFPTETDLTTVTVFCDSGIKSDFLSTMIFMEGSKNIEKHINATDYKIFAADKEKNLYVSEGLEFEVYDNEYRE